MTGFNPYSTWLGIADAASVPNHYRLLGLRLFEDQPGTIAAAAGRLSGVVHGQLSGPYSFEARRVLAEIEAARACLLNPAAKSYYDQSLRQQWGSAPQAPMMSHQPAAESEVVLPPSAFLSPPTPAAGPISSPASGNGYGRSNGSSLPAGEMPQPGPGSMLLVPTAQAVGRFATMPPPPSPSTFAPAPPVAPPAPPMAIPVAAPAPAPPPYAAMPAYPQAAAIPMAQAAIPMAQAAMPLAQAAIPVAAAASTAPAAAPAAAIIAPSTRISWRRRKEAPVLMIGVPVAALVLIAVVVVAFNRPDKLPSTDETTRQVASASRNQDSHDRSLNTDTTRPSQREPEPEPPKPSKMSDNDNVAMNNTPAPVAVTLPEKPATPATPSPPNPVPTPAVPDAKQSEAVTKALNLARVALSKSDSRTARTRIEEARKVGAGNRATEIDRVDALANYIDQFNNAVRQGIKALEIGGQFAVKDSFVGVVEVQPEALTLRVAGMNKTYPISSLPPAIAYALAENWLNKDDSATKIILGTYQAMQPKGDRAEARRLWQVAIATGGRSAAELLMPELDVPLPSENAMAEAESKPGADGRMPLPGATAQTQAKAEAKQMFEADYAEAKDAAAKAALVQKLLARAEQPSDPPPLRYILLNEAARLAAEAGEYDAMSTAVDKLAERYPVEPTGLKADILFEVSKTVEDKDAAKALAVAALTLCDEAVLLDKVPAALKMARSALAAARKSGDSTLIKECSAREKEIKDLK